MRIWRKENVYALSVGMYIGTDSVENNMQVFKKLKIELPCTYNPAMLLQSFAKSLAQEWL